VAQRQQRSLRHEYELFVEEEIETYKESLPRSALLKLGDEAARHLAGEQQLALTELLLCEEVDRIIRRRLRIPAYDTWRRRRLKLVAEMRRPEHWGLRPDDPLVRELRLGAERHVLVAGARGAGSALYLAANGCAVTAIDQQEDLLQRVLDAAVAAGLSQRVRACVGDLGSWAPDAPLNGVVCTPDAFAGMNTTERARTIALLQDATTSGGVHLIEALASGRLSMWVDELRRSYRGWQISVEQALGAGHAFVARKERT
jgi:hypothetical protein